MINSFSQFLVEEEKAVYFTFGRMNPPTIGHGKLLDKLASKAGKNPYRVYLSQSSDAKKNPLAYADKVKFVRKMFPKHARSVMLNKKVKTAIDAAVALYNEGFTKVVMIVGDDRLRDFDILLNRYNGQKARHGFYNFESIKVMSAGQRDPDAEGAEGASATKQRGAASDNDFTAFAQGLPKQMSNKDSKALFNAVRKGMGLKEQKQFRNHVQLKPVSDLREAYVKDGLFAEGDEVVILKNDVVGNIQHLGANYVIVESKGERYRCWLSDISKVDPDPKMNWDAAPYDDPGEDGVVRESLHEAGSMYKNKPDWGTPESTKKAKKITPGYKEDFDINDITADFSVEKQGSMTVGLSDLQEGNGLWANIHAKRRRGERMRKKGEKGAPTPDAIKSAQREKTENPQDPDIADRPGSQPKAYHKGLSKAQKVARDRQFKRQAKMSDDDPKAYKPAPGDKTAKTKPSKHTLKFKKMFGEQDALDMAKTRIDREKKVDARKHDRMMDRARLKDVLKKNRETKA
jgi:hypothetical protein